MTLSVKFQTLNYTWYGEDMASCEIKYTNIVCKNCGKNSKTLLGVELCSIKCIKEWLEEEEYANVSKEKNK